MLEDDERNGYGLMVWKDGLSYRGEYKEDQPTKGKFSWPSGAVYEGQF